MTIITVTQENYSSAAQEQESHKNSRAESAGASGEAAPTSAHEQEPEHEEDEHENRERQIQIERLRNILEFQAISNEAENQKRMKAMEQQRRRIERLERERRELQRKCDEVQIRYDQRHEELRKLCASSKDEPGKWKGR
jgi:hypothetical protein